MSADTRRRYALSFKKKESCAKKAYRRCSVTIRSLLYPQAVWRAIAKSKCVPEIRGSIKRLWVRASSIQSLPLYPLCCWCSIGDGKPSPFQALCALSNNQKRVSKNTINADQQPKHKLQGAGCAADRASRSDDETVWEGDRSSLLESVTPHAVSSALEAHYIPSQLNLAGPSKIAASSRFARKSFLHSFFLPEKSAYSSPYLTKSHLS